MHFQKVISSRIKSISYFSSEKVLEVAFVDSVTYQFIKVSEKTHNDFLTANPKAVFLKVLLKVNIFAEKLAESLKAIA